MRYRGNKIGPDERTNGRTEGRTNGRTNAMDGQPESVIPSPTLSGDEGVKRNSTSKVK